MALCMATLLLVQSSDALADTVNISYLEGQNPVAPDAIAAYGTQMFGDKVNLFNGSLEFEHSDLSLPGNSQLPVTLTRKHVPGRSHTVRGQFGDWDAEVPRISGTFATVSGWINLQGGQNRCSSFSAPPSEPRFPPTSFGATIGFPWLPDPRDPGSRNAVAFIPTDFWNGTTLTVPGHGSQEILVRSANFSAAPTDGRTYPLVTRQNWQISCLPQLLNSAGEGFLAISPDGIQYRFNWMASRSQTSVKKSGRQLARTEFFLMATEVRDRFGNWVRYTFDPTNPLLLTRIESNDGRLITITNAAGRAQSAHDGTRTFYYTYGTLGQLSSVLQPDGSQWRFTLAPMVAPELSNLGEGATCDSPGDFYDINEAFTGIIDHPSGARGTFVTNFRRLGRTGVQRFCWFAPNSTTVTTGAVWPRTVSTQALVEKRITGPAMQPLRWLWAYDAPASWAPSERVSDRRTVTVTEPNGSQTRHSFGNRWRVNEGQLLQVDEGWTGSAALKSTVYRYRDSAAQTYPEQFGTSLLPNSDWLASRNRPQDLRSISLQGTGFHWSVDATPAGFDLFARPLVVSKFSSLGDSRTEQTQYHDNSVHWVFGQVQRLTELTTGREVESNVYHPTTAQRMSNASFGKTKRSYTYHPDGTILTVSDEGGRPTTLLNYRRGKPQLVTYPDTASASQVVNNLGDADSRTNAAGSTTSYLYDLMGRVTLVRYPEGDPVSYHPTEQVFERVNGAEYGLDTGYWRQTIRTGSARKVRYFDALWRERVEVNFDADNPAETTSLVETRYGLDGRVSYEGYPVRGVNYIVGATVGWEFWRDPLGRETHRRQATGSQATGLGYASTFTTYDARSFRKVVTNARNVQTTFEFQAFDDPDNANIRRITPPFPRGDVITFTRDVFGKATSITRGDAASNATRYYVYDAHQRLCKTVEPETGATVLDYDTAGHIQWRASGLALPNLNSCDHASVPDQRKIVFTHDVRNRLTDTSYGDGSPGVNRTYTPDGLPWTISTPGTTWTLGYNQRRLMTSETLALRGAGYGFTYGIDRYGNVASMAYPNGLALTYAPNALGQPTQVSGFLSQIKHHPGGQVASYATTNNVNFSQTLKVQGLPETLRHAGVVQDFHTYDGMGNLSMIVDQERGLPSRSMGYDELDQLRIADGRWGHGQFTYDALGNLRTSRVGNRMATHMYDANSNRLAEIRITDLLGSTPPSTIAIGYDGNGNVTSRAGQTFTFDVGNRMLSAPGVASYAYDGHGRRYLTRTTAGRSTVRAYSQSGRLLLTQDSVKGLTQHIHFGDKVVAEVNSNTGSRWLHTDILGSPVATTGPTGTVLERTEYEPYGLTSVGVNPDGIGYTGHVNDVDTGLVYMQQRYYDPVAGRFLSVDPVTTDAKSGKHFNRYVYAENNPYKYTDPDGRAPHIVFGALVGAASGAYSARQGGASLGSTALAAAGGALAGAASAALPLSGFATATGFLGGFSGSLVGQSVANPGTIPDLKTAVAQGTVAGVAAIPAQAVAAYTGIGLVSASSQAVGANVATVVGAAINAVMPASVGGMQGAAPSTPSAKPQEPVKQPESKLVN